MANLGKNLAGKLFNLHRQGARFTPQEYAAARRIYEGNGNATDLAVVRQALGISRSGATAARRQMRGVARGFQTFGQVGVSLDMLQRGGEAGLAGLVNLVGTGADLAQRAVSSPSVRNLLQATLGPLQGQRAFYSLGRAVRFGGAVAGAALVGGSVGSWLRSSSEQAQSDQARYQGTPWDLRQQTGVGANRIAIEQREIEARLSRGGVLNLGKRTVNAVSQFALGVDAFDAANSRVKASALKRRAQLIASGRDVAETMGVQVADIRGRLGVNATQRSVREAVDEEIAARLPAVSERDIQSELLRRGQWWSTLSLLGPSEQEKEEIRSDIKERSLNYHKKAAERQRKADEWYEDHVLTAADRRVQEVASDQTNAVLATFRSRHQAWRND